MYTTALVLDPEPSADTSDSVEHWLSTKSLEPISSA